MKTTIEVSITRLTVTAGALIAALLAALFGVQLVLGRDVDELRTVALPTQHAVGQLEEALSRLFRREAQIVSAHSLEQLDAQRDRRGIEAVLSKADAELQASLASEPENRARASLLDAQMAEVLASDAALESSVQRRLESTAEFENRFTDVEAKLRHLVEAAGAVAGDAHLEYVLLLRRVAASHDQALVNELVMGKPRAEQSAVAELVAAVLEMGVVAGKIGLARSEDHLNSLVANELNPSRALVRRRFADLLELTGEEGEGAQRATAARVLFEDLVTAIGGDDAARSLVGLRRAILRETTESAEIRNRTIIAAGRVSTNVSEIQGLVSDRADEAARIGGRTTRIVRGVLTIAALGVLVIGWGASRRVKENVHELRAQNLELHRLGEDLSSMNASLEAKVAERSASLEARERSMRLLLDSTGDGFVMADLEGAIVGERSRAATEWFGTPSSDARIWDYLLVGNGVDRAKFALGYAQLAEDMLPFEVAAACIDARFVRDGRSFEVTFRPIHENATLKHVLLIVRDMTERVAVEAAERVARERHDVIACLIRDKQGFQEFVAESRQALAMLATTHEAVTATRAVHTLKGNSATYGLASVASACHALEDTLGARGGAPSPDDVKRLAAVLEGSLEHVAELIAADSSIEVPDVEYEAFIDAIRAHRSHAALLGLAESWRSVRTSTLLHRLRKQAEHVGEGLGKPVNVVIEDNGLRLVQGRLDGFMSSLVHVIRNGIDHGIEDGATRVAAGKPEVGAIRLATECLGDGTFVVRVEDDGRGLDYSAIARRAESAGLPCATREQAHARIFDDGFSTRSTVTGTSGRGVGMAAVRDACVKSHGHVEIDSTEGLGTRFRFAFPAAVGLVARVRPMSIAPRA